jgi:hypothetical protein
MGQNEFKFTLFVFQVHAGYTYRVSGSERFDVLGFKLFGLM